MIVRKYSQRYEIRIFVKIQLSQMTKNRDWYLVQKYDILSAAIAEKNGALRHIWRGRRGGHRGPYPRPQLSRALSFLTNPANERYVTGHTSDLS